MSSVVDPDPDLSIIKQKIYKNLYFHCLGTSLWLYFYLWRLM
jgi:hypothetical protein